MTRCKKTSLTIFLPLTLLQGFERVVEGLHVRGCWRPNVNFIFWPHCYDRHVSFLFSWCWGLLHRGFPRAPSVGCGLPYHIWSLLSGRLLATASGDSKCPLGRVWPSLLHLVSRCLEFYWQLLWDPNSTELNNNSTPTRSPTGSLNRMFNRHQVEITVMQFRGYSLPVHHCQWHNGTFTLSHIISLNPPTRSLSITGHWNVSLPSGVSPWTSIFGPSRRSKYNTYWSTLIICLLVGLFMAVLLRWTFPA